MLGTAGGIRRLALAAAVASLILPASAFATFPGRNGKIAFESGSRVWTINPDGSARRQIGKTNLFAVNPSFSPDGRRIAFNVPGTQFESNYGIWVMNADGSGAHQVTTAPNAVGRKDHAPTWSPDGRRIAFVRGDGGSGELMVMNADGSGTPVNLTAGFVGEPIDPDWSPRGDRILFSYNARILFVTLGGIVTEPLGPSATQHRHPSWSPDGGQLAYDLNSGGTYTIRIVNANGTGDRAVTTSNSPYNVAFAPDGTGLAFSELSGASRLITVGVNGSGRTPITAQGGLGGLDWGPDLTPVFAKSVNVKPVGGTVLIATPGGAAGAGASVAQKGANFVPLTTERVIPVGSLLDTRRGSVRLASAQNARGGTQTGDFSSGVFKVTQARGGRGLTDLTLAGGSYKGCSVKRKRKGRGGPALASKKTKRRVRRLRGNAKGRFRTKGRYSSATVRGTKWETTDRCDGTLTRVSRGRVAVRDNRKRKTINLRAGRSYLAKAPG